MEYHVSRVLTEEEYFAEMSEEQLLEEWLGVNARIAAEDEARTRGQGYWCGTPYEEDVQWRDGLARGTGGRAARNCSTSRR